MKNSIECIFKGYNGRHAILQHNDGEVREYLWPIEKFPAHIPAGELIEIQLKTKEDLKNDFFEAQRKLLEDLIN